jgi:acyl carrier protein
LEEVLATIPTEHPLGAVIHCAGVLADATVETMDPSQIGEVFAPKVDAAHNLHELTADADLTAFVLFSSAAGTLGGPGQANYAAANVFLDTLAQKRGAEGLPATAIAWGLWQREGMGSDLGEADIARMKRSGMQPIADEQGLALFDSAIGADRPQALALPLDTAGLRSAASSGALPPILSALVRTPRRRSAASGSLATKLASLPTAEHESFVLDLVKGEVAAVLGHTSAQEVEPAKAFKEMGFDSLAAVELRNRLNSATGLGLGATTVFDYPSIMRLGRHLLTESGVAGSDTADPADAAFKNALAQVSLDRLREAGLMGPLRELLQPGDDEEQAPESALVDEIDSMDIGDLVEQTLEGRAAAGGDGDLE